MIAFMMGLFLAGSAMAEGGSFGIVGRNGADTGIEVLERYGFEFPQDYGQSVEVARVTTGAASLGSAWYLWGENQGGYPAIYITMAERYRGPSFVIQARVEYAQGAERPVVHVLPGEIIPPPPFTLYVEGYRGGFTEAWFVLRGSTRPFRCRVHVEAGEPVIEELKP
jgi:hypothetical protein